MLLHSFFRKNEICLNYAQSLIIVHNPVIFAKECEFATVQKFFMKLLYLANFNIKLQLHL